MPTTTINKLPHSTQKLINLIGWDATIKLLKARGGTTLYIPANANKMLSLAYLLGDKAASKLIYRWGNQSIRLPKYDHILMHQRNQEVISRANNGDSTASLALAFLLSERTIQRILKTG